MGVADVELVDQRARLVGVYDDHLAGRVGAGEDPHPAAHGVRLLELLGLDGGREGRKGGVRLSHISNPIVLPSATHLPLLRGAVAALLAVSVLLGVEGIAGARQRLGRHRVLAAGLPPSQVHTCCTPQLHKKKKIMFSVAADGCVP